MARILVLGASGMLGSAMIDFFNQDSSYEVWGTLRADSSLEYFSEKQRECLLLGVDVLSQDDLASTLAKVRPDVVINCIGLIKQLADANDPLSALPINAMLPHRLAILCKVARARLVHISTDCVFKGDKGGYLESDVSDATDLYGKSKFLGEVHDQDHVVTLRTSIIGHGINPNSSLIDWFLAQSGQVKGFSKAVFSGLPTFELARVIRDYVLPKPQLSGLYHVSVAPIDKYTLLNRVAAVYGKDIEVLEDDRFCIDRSLNSDRFQRDSGYQPPCWDQLISFMFTNK